MFLNNNKAYFDYKAAAKVRRFKQITQEQLAYNCDVSIVTISNLETGKYSPKLDLYYKLCQALKVPFGSFIKHE